MHKPIVEGLSFYLSRTISFKAAAYFGIPKITGSDVLYITLMLSLNLFWKENKKTWIAYFKQRMENFIDSPTGIFVILFSTTGYLPFWSNPQLNT